MDGMLVYSGIEENYTATGKTLIGIGNYFLSMLDSVYCR